MQAIVWESDGWINARKNGLDPEDIKAHVTKMATNASEIFPNPPVYLNITIEAVRPEDVIPEIGVLGVTYNQSFIQIMIDSTNKLGVHKIKNGITGSMFHELTRVVNFVRNPWEPGIMYGVVTEGLTCVVERDYSSVSRQLWTEYSDDETMTVWYAELKSLGDTQEKDKRYFFERPDGRKWIVYRTGRWMIDKLVESGEDLFDLMQLKYTDVIEKFERLSWIKN